jgi:outer membrane lipoprotein-sorting protein
MFKKVLIAAILVFGLLLSAAYCAEKKVSPEVSSFLNNLEDAIYKMDTYTCVMISENWKGKKYEYKVTKFQFKKPNLIRTDVLDGDKKGSTVILNKEGKIRGKNSMGLRKTLKPDDSRLKNIRGATFMQASFIDMIDRLKDHILERGCKARVIEEQYMDKPAYHLIIEHEDGDDPVTLEEVWYDKTTYFIMKKLKYEGEKKVTDIMWKDCQINAPIEDSLFVQ